MADNPATNPIVPRSAPALPGIPGSLANAPARSTGVNPAFRALLEGLSERAQAVSQDAHKELQPAELAQAVDRARASLDDALSLSDQLLEAYRQRVVQHTDPRATP